MRDWQRWVPGGLLALGCLLTLGVNRQRLMPLAQPLGQIPLTLAGHTGRDLSITAEEQQVAGMTSYLYRVYDSAPTPFTVYVGYYDHQTQGKAIHSPKNCLPGAGWEALTSTEETIQTPIGPRTVNRYLLQNNQQRALVLYWYQGRGRVAANEYRVKWELLRDAALLGRSEESLVRVVVYLNEQTDEAAASQLAESVAGALIPAVRKVLPPV